jgi:uncharacterized protein (TIGR03083 family)
VPTFREQEVRFAFDGDAVRANRLVRERQLDVLGGIPFEDWTRPSRCAGWAVHDVVRHVVQMNEVMAGTAAAAREGERYERMRGFDPRTTPSAWLAAAPAAEPEETLAAFDATTRAVIDAGEALDADRLVGSPAGRQPWTRVLLHALFDTLVHERDVTEPLGRPTPYAAEHLPVLAYALLLAARAACAYGREFGVRVDLGEQALDVSVRGPAVDVVTVAERDGAIGADPLLLLDGLSGRVALGEVLAAPDDVGRALGLLARSL